MKRPEIVNKNSSEWCAVRDFTKNRIKDLHAELEGKRNEYDTAVIRGKISLAREILSLEEKQATIDIEPVDYD